jgi:hypothetical protein
VKDRFMANVVDDDEDFVQLENKLLLVLSF